MGRLTTHVLDTASGKPAAGMKVDLHRWGEHGWKLVKKIITNDDGRADEPLLQGEECVVGHYRLMFKVGEYFQKAGSADAKKFLDHVPIDFTIADAEAHYHVPLLCSPWAYSTYRGS